MKVRSSEPATATRLPRYFSDLLEAGVEPGEAKRTRVVNGAALLGVVLYLSVVPWMLLKELPDLAIFVVIQAIGCAFVIALNRRGRGRAARMLLLSGSALGISYIGIRVGSGAGLELWLVCSLGQAFYLFPRDLLARWSSILLHLFAWGALELYHFYEGPWSNVLAPHELELANRLVLGATMGVLLYQWAASSRAAISRESHLEAIVERVRAAILTCDALGRVKTANTAARRMFGYPSDAPSAMDGVHLSSLIEDLPLSAISSPALAGSGTGTTVNGGHFPLEYGSTRYSVGGHDEITIVLRDLTSQQAAQEAIEQAHQRMSAMARTAGMAEVASNVLHNVGNSLNSVNAAAFLAMQRVNKSRVWALSEVVAVLRSKRHDLDHYVSEDPKGQQIFDVFDALVAELEDERDEVRRELTRLQDAVEHIKRVVAAQQELAAARSLVEEVDLAAVVEQALAHYADGMARHGIRVVRELDPLGPVTTDKHRLMQILVNLLHNAKDAMRPRGSGRLLLTVRSEGDDAVVAVEDDGVGVDPTIAGRIFEHGFTTKPDGHGFGLHSCALHAEALGGKLSASSDGLDQGARFELRLPRGGTPTLH